MLDRREMRRQELLVQSLQAVDTKPLDALIKGHPVRGRQITMAVDEDDAEGIARNSSEFSFYQAVHLAELAAGQVGITGKLGPVTDEPMRFRAQFGLGFPASELGRAEFLDPATGDEAPTHDLRMELEVNFFGLYGSSAPLTAELTERLIHQDETGTTRDFLDIFNHRLISLLYRIWRHSRIELERRPALDDLFSTAVKCTAGLGDDGIADEVDKGALLSSLRHLIGWTRSAHDLRSVLCQQFPQATFAVEEFVEREFLIAEDDQWSLGRGRLGDDVVLGNRMVDSASRIRLHVMAPDWDSYLLFLPSGSLFSPVTQITRRLLREQIDVIIVPSLPASAVLPAQLNATHQALGLSTWLGQPEGDQRTWPGFALGQAH